MCIRDSILRIDEVMPVPRNSALQLKSLYIRGILMHVASGLFSWSMAAGLLAFSSRQFALTYDQIMDPCPLHDFLVCGIRVAIACGIRG